MTGRDGLYSIGLPLGWVNNEDIINDPAFVADVGEQLEDVDLGGFEDVIGSMIGNGDIDFGFDLKTFTLEFVENINIFGVPASPTDTPAFAIAVAPSQIEAVDGTVTGTDLVMVGIYEAARISYEIPDLLVFTGEQYWILAEGHVWIVTFSGGNEADSSEWREMIDTFTVADR